jgi:ATP-dependent exoDNAse (exonuclease V) alpha subunit
LTRAEQNYKGQWVAHIRAVGGGVATPKVIVQFADERAISYDYADLSELSPAWAVTIHKSQGSEYPVVILSLFM